MSGVLWVYSEVCRGYFGGMSGYVGGNNGHVVGTLGVCQGY